MWLNDKTRRCNNWNISLRRHKECHPRDVSVRKPRVVSRKKIESTKRQEMHPWFSSILSLVSASRAWSQSIPLIRERIVRPLRGGQWQKEDLNRRRLVRADPRPRQLFRLFTAVSDVTLDSIFLDFGQARVSRLSCPGSRERDTYTWHRGIIISLNHWNK